MLNEIKPLYDLGFTPILLHKKSKIPVDSGWTRAERPTWDDFKIKFHTGFNIGVRLGRPSHIPGQGFLGVIDCDVKSQNPLHLKELEQKLSQLFPGISAKTPAVKSGRGNGSKHIYVVSDSPLVARRLAQSSEKVKVHMPSVRPSKHELEVLSGGEISSGLRLRVAWEISLMGDGQQVVLPPSIHPDSGNAYEWILGSAPARNSIFLKVNQAPILNKSEKLTQPSDLSFKLPEVDLWARDLPEDLFDLIVEGEGCNDRSAMLLPACSRLLRLGFTRDEILSVLTNRDNFLGETAFDHAKTTNRKRAADWVLKYTLQKAMDEQSAEKVFSDVVEELPLLDEFEAQAQAALIKGMSGENWKRDLELNNFQRLKNTMKNVMLILQGECGPKVFIRNLFTYSETYGVNSPWGGKVGDEITDRDIILIKKFLTNNYQFEPSNDRIIEAITAISDENSFHPVRDYLKSLEWDGIPRISSWLADYLGAAKAPEPYLSDISRKVLVAMVARAFNPGVKYESVLILEGAQGVGKSMAARILGGSWFSDASIQVGNKDGQLALKGVWLNELGELSSMRKADVDALKEFISHQQDKFRPPYGRKVETHPRQNIFIGTTNSDEYLRDVTGNRRYWPVFVGETNLKGLTAVRDQLFAEARYTFENFDEPLWLENPISRKQAEAEQGERVFEDSWIDLFNDFFSKEESEDLQERFPREEFTIHDLFKDNGPLARVKDTRAEQMRAASVLKQIGAEKKIVRRENKTKRIWTIREEK